MNASTHHAPLAERLLVEWVCHREEAAGHPAPAGPADATAMEQGGSFAARLHLRALRLPGSDVALAQIERTLFAGRVMITVLLLFSTMAGAFAASAALDAAASVSLPLILFALVGINLLMLALWVLMQVVRAPGASWLVAVWTGVVRRIASRGEGENHAGLDAIRLLAQRWRVGAVVHAAWLSYALAGLVTLALLLILRRYELSWQTTLLDADGLRHLAAVLSLVPRLLGAPGPEVLALVEPFTDADRRGWAQWILLAVLAYGVLPRAVALLVCLAMLQPAGALEASALNRPGHARLRERLMPDRRAVGVVDADRAPQSVNAQAGISPCALPDAPLHGVAVEWPQARPPASARWKWFAHVDDTASRDEVAKFLRGESSDGLVLVLRATATPDRGLARASAALIAAARAPAWVALGDLDALEARGAEACAQRLSDWRALAAQAGAQHGLLGFDAKQGVLSALTEKSA